jgi:hypothetical protein
MMQLPYHHIQCLYGVPSLKKYVQKSRKKSTTSHEIPPQRPKKYTSQSWHNLNEVYKKIKKSSWFKQKQNIVESVVRSLIRPEISQNHHFFTRVHLATLKREQHWPRYVLPSLFFLLDSQSPAACAF